MSLLEIKNLCLEFGSGKDAVRAVDGLSLSIGEGETVCLVGESGSGKSVTALSVARLVPSPPANYPEGEILVNGRDVLKMSKRELRQIRGGDISMIFGKVFLARRCSFLCISRENVGKTIYSKCSL
mgnify:CR=1 FL=1